MRAPARIPPRVVSRRSGWLAVALVVSAALHAAALAALILWPPERLPDAPGPEGGVALIFTDTVSQAGGQAADPGEAPAQPEQAQRAETPPAPPPEAPPAPQDSVAEAPAAAAQEPAPPQPAVAAPAPEEPAPAPSLAEDASDPLPPPPPPPPAEAQPAASPAPRPGPPVRLAARPPPTAGGPAESEPIRLGAGVDALPHPSLGARALGAVVPPGADSSIRNAPPAYPAESRRRGEEGLVRLILRIGPDGRVMQAEVETGSGYPALDRAALDAARRWRFRPATQAGLPVQATLTTGVHFRLDEGRRR